MQRICCCCRCHRAAQAAVQTGARRAVEAHVSALPRNSVLHSNCAALDGTQSGPGPQQRAHHPSKAPTTQPEAFVRALVAGGLSRAPGHLRGPWTAKARPQCAPQAGTWPARPRCAAAARRTAPARPPTFPRCSLALLQRTHHLRCALRSCHASGPPLWSEWSRAGPRPCGSVGRCWCRCTAAASTP